jgi:hypothetical protein
LTNLGVATRFPLIVNLNYRDVQILSKVTLSSNIEVLFEQE